MPHIHLFGTGYLVPVAAKIAKNLGWGCSLRTSQRIWNTSSSLAKEVTELNVSVIISDDLQEAMKQGQKVEEGDVAFSFGAP